ncbi:hypothetical protein DL768_005979 [Monosporascus sp. mg162]|nr:hypothetical protein DL768_005979 [Monosporascus sp. mg162]
MTLADHSDLRTIDPKIVVSNDVWGIDSNHTTYPVQALDKDSWASRNDWCPNWKTRLETMSHTTGGADEFAATPGPTPSSRALDGELDAIHEPSSKRRRLTTASFTRRKRAATACQFCRLRKTKCDTARPTCGFCRYHQAKCVYDDDGEEENLSSGVNGSLSNYVIELGEQVLSSLGEVKQMLRQPQQHEHSQQQQASTSIACSFTHASAARPTIWARATDENCPPPASVLLPQPQSPPCSPYMATRCESILRWPVFKRTIKEEDAEIQSFLFESDAGASLPDYALPRASGTSLPGIEENAFVPLCRKFLIHVYPRNPILEKEHLMSYAKDAAANGLKWDASSCLVLLACALACYTRPWEPQKDFTPGAHSGIGDAGDFLFGQDDGAAAEAYYQAAKKRIGLLGSSIIDIQCLFFASIFERYSLRLVDAWFYIQMACTRLQAHLMRKNRRNTVPSDSINDPAHLLEQRVFWTCVKAESELSPDMALRPSGLGDFAYPDLFPTPPSNMSFSHGEQVDKDDESDTMSHHIDENRSWLFYLAEISLRRTIDDTLWLLYNRGEEHWINNVDLLVRQYAETDKQISLWYSHLPSSIRFDPLQPPENEFSFYLQHRFLHWRENALRPLLYIALHHPSHPPRAVLEASRESMRIASQIILTSAQHHRHGGIWFVLRRAFTCALLILAVVLRYGEAEAPQNWPDMVGTALKTLERWSPEAPDVARMRDVLDRAFATVWQRQGGDTA